MAAPPPTSTATSPLTPTLSSFAQVDGISIYHTFTRTPTSPLLLLLHGFGASSFSFKPCTPPLLRNLPDYSLVSYDSVAFGRSQRPSSLHYYTPQFSARVASALADAYTPQSPYVLVAHSLGAIAAAQTYLDNPHRISKIVLIAPALLPQPNIPPPLRMVARALGSLGAWAVIAASYALGLVLEAVLKGIVSQKTFWKRGLGFARGDMTVPDYIVDGYFDATGIKGWERGILNFSRAALRDRVRALGVREDFVKSMVGGGDVLIVHGEKDRVVPLSNSKRLAEIWGCKLVVFEDSGHVPHEEEAERFAKVVTEFLNNNV